MTACHSMPARALRAAGAALIGAALVAPTDAEAQESPTLRLSAAPGLAQQVEDAPAELSWTEIPSRLTVEFPTSAPLDLDRVPVHLVAIGVRDGEIVGEATTSPSVVAVGGSARGAEMAGSAWPPVGDWFPAPRWQAADVSTADPVTPVSETVASEVRVPPGAAGAVILYAAPAAGALQKRFVSVPVVVTTRPSGPAADTGTAGADSTGG